MAQTEGDTRAISTGPKSANRLLARVPLQRDDPGPLVTGPLGAVGTLAILTWVKALTAPTPGWEATGRRSLGDAPLPAVSVWTPPRCNVGWRDRPH